ncbi:MAG TPA: hypothetical protein VGM84_15885 [Steroidobacteraceae bacterium]|jgi:hypothetical protein
MKLIRLLWVLVLSGCASHQIIPAAKVQARAMSDTEARSHIRALIQPSDKAGGFCFFSGVFTAAEDGKVVQSGDELHFRATYSRDAEWNSKPSRAGTQLTRNARYATGDFVLDFRHVSAIRLLDVEGDNRACQQKRGHGSIVVVDTDDHLSVTIQVTDPEVRELVASLVHFAPAAVVRSGRSRDLSG